jgi:hypothetical protein
MGEEAINFQNYDLTGKLLVTFMIGFLVFCIASAYYYKNWMLGSGRMNLHLSMERVSIVCSMSRRYFVELYSL